MTWKIKDDWDSGDTSYSVIHDSHNLYMNNLALKVSPEYKQRYEQIYKGQTRQSQRITLDKLKYSKFLQSNV